MAGKAASKAGVMGAIRARAGCVVRLLLAALLLQVAGPVPGLVAHAFSAPASSDLVVICSEGGVHTVHLADGTPADKPAFPTKDGDCCTAACHVQSILIPPFTAAEPQTTWIAQQVEAGIGAPPLPSTPHPFDARGPPLDA